MKTLVLLYPGCISFEVMLACEMLHARFPVEVITPDGRDHVGSNGLVVRAAGSLVSAQASEYKVALFPGGNPEALVGNETLNALVRQLHTNGAILGAICAGPLLLEQAGTLRGLRVAHGYEEPQIEFLRKSGFFVESKLTNEACLTEGHIVTARPDAFIDFAVEIGRLAAVIPGERVSFWREYYRGLSRPE